MAGFVPVFEHGPLTFEVTEAVSGGQLIEARAGSKVGVAAAGSITCVGVALKDAVPAGTNQNSGDVVNLSPKGQYTTAGRNAFYRMKYASAAAFGDRLACAADGQVAPAGATPDPRAIVGYCADPAGVAAGATGVTYIGN